VAPGPEKLRIPVTHGSRPTVRSLIKLNVTVIFRLPAGIAAMELS
jgi:hypothetical protein